MSTFQGSDPTISKTTHALLVNVANHSRSEAVAGTIPEGRNLPQKLKNGLFPERISGTSFTAPRKDNKQRWLYRTVPSTNRSQFQRLDSHPANFNQRGSNLQFSPNQVMWMPFQVDPNDVFVTDLRQIAGAGEPTLKKGVAYYTYCAGRSMPNDQAFSSSDGDFLIGKQRFLQEDEGLLIHLIIS